MNASVPTTAFRCSRGIGSILSSGRPLGFASEEALMRAIHPSASRLEGMVPGKCLDCGKWHLFETLTPEECSAELRRIRSELPRSSEGEAYREMRECLAAVGRKAFDGQHPDA